MALVGKRDQGRVAFATSSNSSLNAIQRSNIGKGILHDITLNVVGLNLERNEDDERDYVFLEVDGLEYWGSPVNFVNVSNNLQYASGLVEQMTGSPIPMDSLTSQDNLIPVRHGGDPEKVFISPPLDSHLGQIHFMDVHGAENSMLAIRVNSRLNIPFQDGFRVGLKANGKTENNTSDRVIRATARYSVEV
mgnify:CR=1 FL=1